MYIPNSVYDIWVLPHEQATLTINVTMPRNIEKSTIFPWISSTWSLYSECGGTKSMALWALTLSSSICLSIEWWWECRRSLFPVNLCKWFTSTFAVNPRNANIPRQKTIAFDCDSFWRFILEPFSSSLSKLLSSLLLRADEAAGFFRSIVSRKSLRSIRNMHSTMDSNTVWW